MKKTLMLDTNICSFIMREQPAAVLKRLEQAVLRGDRIVVSAVTYAEMRFGATGRRPRRAIFSWSTRLRAPRCRPALGPRRGGRHDGHPGGAAPSRDAIGPNDTAIAGTPSRRAPSW